MEFVAPVSFVEMPNVWAYGGCNSSDDDGLWNDGYKLLGGIVGLHPYSFAGWLLKTEMHIISSSSFAVKSQNFSNFVIIIYCNKCDQYVEDQAGTVLRGYKACIRLLFGECGNTQVGTDP